MAAPKINPQIPQTPGALLRMGCALMGSGEGAKAVALLEGLLDRSPDDAELRAAARTILSHNVPRWHGAMLRDERRNDAFERVIQRAVRPDRRVLDIGTGSGLLAMMAARAGARSVVACEAHGALAVTARKIVAANGYGDVIEVLTRRSTELDVKADLGGFADVIVAEVFSDNLLGEGALSTLSHARAELAGESVQMIPAAASIRVALAFHNEAPETPPLRVKGFDVSLFERHVAPDASVRVGGSKLHLRSEAHDLFSFDFQAGGPFGGERAQVTLAAAGGSANGLVQWIRLQLDADTRYENRPDPDAPSHWAAIFHPFPHEQSVPDGGKIVAHASHDTEHMQIWFSRP
jgi:type II protein arginine methyltransferase